ncbi:MAG: hypothetical protein ABSG90_11540 [Dehalococcoidia bacterium]|jgi:hypothetical protein
MPTGATLQEEIITGPKPGEETLADELDNRREVTGDMLMGGHPNEEPEKEETPVAGEEEKPPEKGEGEEEKPPEKKEPTFRFKDQETAEKSHAEAEKEMTKAKMEAAALQRELDELKIKPPEKKEEIVKPPEPSVEEREADLLKQATAIRAKAAADINELDRTAEDYLEQWAAITEKANLAIRRAERRLFPLPAAPEDIDSRIDAKIKADREADRLARAEEDRKTAGERAWEDALNYGKKAGLKLEDQESADYDLFDVAGQKLPQEMRGKGATPEAVEWMVNYVRTRTGKVVLSEAEKHALARKTQQENQPLGKGGIKPKPKQPQQETEGSLKDDFEEARGRRIL